MDSDQSERYRQRLIELRDELRRVASSGDASAAVVELDQARVGRLSRMDAMQAQAMASASKQRRQQLLGRIDASLKRIDEGNYGYCQGCEEPIDPRRLDFDPTALFCIDCASRRES